MPKDWRTRWARFSGLAVLAALIMPNLLNGHSVSSVRAATINQESLFPYARLAALDIQQFPRVQTYLEVYDPSAYFVEGLSTSEVKIIENDHNLPTTELTELNPGVQFVLAVTFGESMGIRDGLGRTRYDYLLENLNNWVWDTHPQNPDDLSLLIDNGPEVIHQTDSQKIMQSLLDFKPDPRQAVPNLQILSRALEVALDPNKQPGMQPAILFITSNMGGNRRATIM